MKKFISLLLGFVMVLNVSLTVLGAVNVGDDCAYCGTYVDVAASDSNSIKYTEKYGVSEISGLRTTIGTYMESPDLLLVEVIEGGGFVCLSCLEEKINGYKSEYQRETTVSYIGDCDEYFEVNVPSILTPGDSKTVTVNGTWASNRKLTVTAPMSVELINSISGADEKELDIIFSDIELVGDNTTSVSKSESIEVQDISNALFGTWEGNITYTISMSDI